MFYLHFFLFIFAQIFMIFFNNILIITLLTEIISHIFFLDF